MDVASLVVNLGWSTVVVTYLAPRLEGVLILGVVVIVSNVGSVASQNVQWCVITEPSRNVVEKA